MRIAYVAGFFSPVLAGLQGRMGKELKKRSVIWIPQFSSGDLDVGTFTSSFFDVIKRGATHILICLFLFRDNKAYLSEVLNHIIEQGKLRSADLQVEIVPFKNARDLEGVIGKIKAFKPSSEPPLPDNLEQLEQWVQERHGKKVSLHPRAVDSAKRGMYLEIEDIYAAINVLGQEYWDMKMAVSKDALQHYQEKLQELGLEIAPFISASRAGEQGDEYYVHYPPGTLFRRLLDLHLKKGSDRDERHCLRIYFFWDDDSKQVIIGWLPSHLDTRST